MPNIILAPNADGTTLDFTPSSGGAHNADVDDVAGADDGTTIDFSGNSTGNDFLGVDDVPGDFDTSTSFVVEFRSALSGVVDDTIIMRVAVFEDNETTQVGTEISHAAGDHSIETTTGGVDTAGDADATTWNARKLRFQCNRSNSGMPDSIAVQFSAGDVDVTYDAAATDDQDFAGTRAENSIPPTYRLPSKVVGY